MAKLTDLIEYAHDVQKNVMDYNTTDFSLYAYALAKMTKPETMVEFGTGMGVTSFMLAQACKDNDYGKVITIDDGSQNLQYYPNYFENLQDNVRAFDLQDTLEFRQATIDSDEAFEKVVGDVSNVGIVFNDFNSEPEVLYGILKWLLPRAADECYFITDRGYTYEPNYRATETLVSHLNDYEESRRFSTHYVKKQASNNQDSFSIIKMELKDA